MEKRKVLFLAAAAGAAAGAAATVLARRAERYDLRGKTVLITGGARGLGLVLAREFAREGARLAICARDPDEVERGRQDLESRGADVLAVPCDITDREQAQGLVGAARERFGRIDVLVNNAGVIQVGPLEAMTLEDYEEALDIHFRAPLYLVNAVLPEMRARRAGRIVNISSMGGRVAFPHLAPYTASKFALTGFSEALRAELSAEGIRVTTVCPGLMRTGSHLNAFFKGRNRAEFAWFSILNALPVSSISAERAARRIVTACRRGEADLVFTLPAQVITRLHGLFPGLTAKALGGVDRLLPEPGGLERERARGWESRSRLAPRWITAPSDRAARENNEVPAAS